MLRLALHELRTPLTSVQLNAQLLERSLVKLGLEKECRLAQTIISAARKLDALTQELGDLARLRSGKVPLDLHEHDLSQILPAILSRNVGAPESGRLRVVVPAGPLPITADARCLDRILTNLILVGLRLETGGTGIDLRVSANEAEVQINIAVPADASRTKRALPSDDELGLGFFLARILIECHGGQLEVQMGPAREIVLRFSLPNGVRA